MANTFATLVSSGTSPGTDFLFIIEGCRYIFASSPVSEQVLADGRTIVRGLKRDSLGISENAYLAGATLDLSMPSITIEETAGPYRDAATRAFTGWIGESVTTWLDAAITKTGTTLTVRSTAGISAADVIHVGTEAMSVDAVVDGTTLTVTRGVWGTTAQAFAVEHATTLGLELDLVPVSTEPACYANRRCWLYGRGLDDLTSSAVTAGTVLWRGVLSADPELQDSMTWQIGVSSRLALFEGKIGSEKLSETRLRGAYYPDRSPIQVTLQRRNGTSATDAYLDEITVTHSGFYENNEAFGVGFAAAINTAMSGAGWTGAFHVEEWDGVWQLFYTTASASPKFIQLQGGSPIDGWFDQQLRTAVRGFAGVLTTTVVASTTYRCTWADRVGTGSGLWFGAAAVPVTDMRRIPRACYIEWFGTVSGGSWPFGRWYLNNVSGYPSGGSMVITPPPTEAETAPEPLPAITITTSSADGYVEAPDAAGERREWGASGATQPTIDVAIRFNVASGINLADFMAAITNAAADSANTGVMPFVTSDDVADWTEEVGIAAGTRLWLQHRDYVFAKPQKLIDIIKHECRLYGLFLKLDSSGKIAVQRITPKVDTPSTTLDATRHAPGADGDFGSVRVSPDGMIGSVIYKFQYDTREDKHLDTWTFTGRGIQQTVRGKAQPIEIAPYVNPSGATIAGPDEVKGQVASLLTLYGSRRYVYDIPVTMQLHGLRVGDGVLLTIPQLPFVGQRGATVSGTGLVVTRATVVGRTWNYGEAPSGRLSLLVHGLDIAGYAPTGRVASASGATTSWTLTLSAAQYGPGGAIADASYFIVGSIVRLVEWDSATPTERFGTVSAQSGNDVSVTLTSAWAGLGGATYNLRFVNADHATQPTTAQRRYAFDAGSDGRIAFDAPNDRPARIFA